MVESACDWALLQRGDPGGRRHLGTACELVKSRKQRGISEVVCRQRPWALGRWGAGTRVSEHRRVNSSAAQQLPQGVLHGLRSGSQAARIVPPTASPLSRPTMNSTLTGQARILGAVCVFLWLERARAWGGDRTTIALLDELQLLFLFPPLSISTSYARFKESGMGFRAAGLLVKAWYSWGGSALFRLVGLPAAFFTIYLELYGSSPITASLILHRLRRRILLSASCTRKYGQDMSAILDLSGPAAGPAGTASADAHDARTPARHQTPAAAKGAPRAKSTQSIMSTPTSTPLALPSPKMPASHSRAKTIPHIDLVGQGKRLSLQFPIQPAAGSNSSPKASPPATRPQSWIGTPASARTTDSPSSLSEVNILAVLAAQERFVLELREELKNAEADLTKLKTHYARHEVLKLRNEARKVAPLQPLNTLLANNKADQDDDDDSGLAMQRETDRKKALLNNVKTPQRKVFSGSRHLRTLSLLSPEKSYTPSFPQPLDLLDDEPIPQRPSLPSHSLTSPDIRKQPSDDINTDRFDLGPMPNIQREKIIRASTQMASDLKNSLFNFIDDLKSATVGDEAVLGTDRASLAASTKAASAKSVRKGSDGRPLTGRRASTKATSPRTGSIGDDFWKENGLSEPKSAAAIKNTPSLKAAQTPQKQTSKPVDEDEDWITWDTPNDNHNSSDDSDGAASPVSGPGSSRTSTRYHSKRHDSKSSLTTISSAGHPDDSTSTDAKRDMTSWSDLAKLSPVNIKQKASHLMKEWEKQLTPPPESRTGSHAHGDYLGRSSSPPSLI